MSLTTIKSLEEDQERRKQRLAEQDEAHALLSEHSNPALQQALAESKRDQQKVELLGQLRTQLKTHQTDLATYQSQLDQALQQQNNEDVVTALFELIGQTNITIETLEAEIQAAENSQPAETLLSTIQEENTNTPPPPAVQPLPPLAGPENAEQESALKQLGQEKEEEPELQAAISASLTDQQPEKGRRQQGELIQQQRQRLLRLETELAELTQTPEESDTTGLSELIEQKAAEISDTNAIIMALEEMERESLTETRHHDPAVASSHEATSSRLFRPPTQATAKHQHGLDEELEADDVEENFKPG